MSSCCSTDGSCTTNTATATVTTGVVTVYTVSGMTCGHCKSAVTKEVGALGSVLSVDVDVAAGRVRVVTDGEPDQAAIAGAVDEAGYELTGRA